MKLSRACRLTVLVVCFIIIFAIFRGPMDTGWHFWGDCLAAVGWTAMIQYLPFLRVM